MGKWESWWETQDTGEGERDQEGREESQECGGHTVRLGFIPTLKAQGHGSTVAKRTGPRRASHQAPPPAALSPPWETVRSAP